MDEGGGMKPVDQLILADPARGDGHNTDGVPGDCWRACVASILEMPADYTPHFLHVYPEGDEWWYQTQTIVHEALAKYLHPEPPAFPYAGEDYLIATGPSPRGDFHHSVIVSADGSLAHDPHPSRAGLTSISEVCVLR